MTLLAVEQDHAYVPQRLTLSFETEPDISRAAAKLRAPWAMRRCQNHLKSEGYEWMGALGYGPPYSQVEFTGPYPAHEAPTMDGSVGGSLALLFVPATKWKWRVKAWYLHRQTELQIDLDEVAAAEQSVQAEFDRLDFEDDA